MKNLLFVLAMLMSIGSGYAQNQYSTEFGKMTQYEMSMTEYPEDKDAEAVVLYEIGDSYIQGDHDKGLQLHMMKSMKIKILKSAGIKYADIEIPYYIEGDRDLVTDIEAVTYNFVDGKLTTTKLEKRNIFEEKYSEYWNALKFTMPDVREGSVIEIRYKVISNNFFNMRKWEFQKKIPVVYSLLKYRAIPYYEYSYILTGTDKFDVFSSKASNSEIRFGNLVYREMFYEFGLKNIPAFKDVDFIGSESDYMISLNFQLAKIYYPQGGTESIISTWPEMNKELLGHSYFGKYVKDVEKSAKKLFPEIGVDINGSQKNNADIIYNYVNSMYDWNGVNDKYAIDKLSDFMKKKSGNSAQLNLMLVGLLNAAKIEAYPVVLSTRSHGMIRKSYPFMSFINYVLVQATIDGKVYYIDATQPLLPFGDLPVKCTNIEGLVVKPKVEEWISINQNTTALTHKNFDLKVDLENNVLDADVTFESWGADAFVYRKVYFGDSEGAEGGKDEYLLTFLHENNNIRPKNGLTVSNQKDLDKPFTFSFKTDLALERVGDKIFINPFCNLSPSDNKFKQMQRTHGVDLALVDGGVYTSTIEIPDGYKVESLPRPIVHDGKAMKINYKVEVSGNKLLVSADYLFKKNYYSAAEYLTLKMSFAEVVKAFPTMIVLVKKEATSAEN